MYSIPELVANMDTELSYRVTRDCFERGYFLLKYQYCEFHFRRSIHRCMRQRYKPGTNIPNWLRDSLDETEPWHMRIAHLKMRLSDVLKK